MSQSIIKPTYYCSGRTFPSPTGSSRASIFSPPNQLPFYAPFMKSMNKIIEANMDRQRICLKTQAIQPFIKSQPFSFINRVVCKMNLVTAPSSPPRESHFVYLHNFLRFMKTNVKPNFISIQTFQTSAYTRIHDSPFALALPRSIVPFLSRYGLFIPNVYDKYLYTFPSS